MIKLLWNLFVLNTGLNFLLFLRFKLLVLRAGRRSWSLFSSLWIILSNNSWRRSEVWFGQCLIVWAKGKDDVHCSLLFSFNLVGKVCGETVMGDRTCILRDRTNTNAEKLLQLTDTKTRSFKLCHSNNLCQWRVMCLLNLYVTDVTENRKRKNKNLTAEWSRHRDKFLCIHSDYNSRW